MQQMRETPNMGMKEHGEVNKLLYAVCPVTLVHFPLSSLLNKTADNPGSGAFDWSPLPPPAPATVALRAICFCVVPPLVSAWGFDLLQWNCIRGHTGDRAAHCAVSPSHSSRLSLISVAYITQISGHVLCGQAHAWPFKTHRTHSEKCFLLQYFWVKRLLNKPQEKILFLIKQESL